MKPTLYFIVLSLLGLIWLSEKFSAGQMLAELGRLRQQHDEMTDLLRGRDRLRQRLNDAEKLEKVSAEQVTVTPEISTRAAKPEIPLRATLPLGDWVDVRGWGFRGQATPQASIESALWAAAGGDVASFRQLLSISDAVRTEATSCQEAETAAREGNFDLLISDIGLPDGSGLEIMQRLGTKFTGRAIALSGYGMEADISAARDAGFTTHLTKPIKIEQLANAIARTVGSANAKPA